MADSFRFKRFEAVHGRSALKVGTDAVVLGAAMTISASDRRLLDIGTGCGVVALMCAQRLGDLVQRRGAIPGFRISGIDIDAPSTEDAKDNFAASPWPGNLAVQCVPLAEYAPEEPLDLIFSNPPFFEKSLKNPDPREMSARHTDTMSYRDICAFAAQHLGEEGRLSLILPFEAADALRRTAASYGLYPFRLLAVRTTPTKAPKRILAEFSRTKTQVAEEELTLQDGPLRSAQYAELTEDFYL